jgi:hypothetical protein
MNIWTQCYLAFLKDRAKYPQGHRFHPKDYESFLVCWYNDFCND